MKLQHLKWGQGGRVFQALEDDGITPIPGRKIQWMMAGVRHVQKVDGSYTPFEWDSGKRELKYYGSPAIHLKLTANGIEWYQDGFKKMTVAFHPEISVAGTWTRKTASVSGLQFETIDDEGPTRRAKLSYTVTTADGSVTISLIAGGLPRSQIEFDVVTSVNCDFNIVMETDQAEAGEDIVEIQKSTGQQFKVGEKFSNGWRIGWRKDEVADHEPVFVDNKAKVNLLKGAFKKNVHKTLNPTTLTPSIAAGADDGEIDGSSYWYPNGEGVGTVYFGEYASNLCWGYFRFQITEPIDDADTINTSYITLTAADNWQWELSTDILTVRCDQSDNAAAVDNINDCPGGAGSPGITTAVSGNWVPSAWTTNTGYQSPSLNAIFSELADDYGSIADNDYVQLWVAKPSVQGQNKELGTYDFYHATGTPAQLYLDFTAAGGGPATHNTHSWPLGTNIGMALRMHP